MRRSLMVPLGLFAWATFALCGYVSAQPKSDPLVSAVGATQAMSGTQSGVLPQNLNAADALRPTLHIMWQRSRTFRAQCARIERAPSLQVMLTRVRGTRVSTSGARTEFTRSSHRLHAAVIVSLDVSSNALIELIAHELEHVVEQLDGVHLTDSAEKGISRNARDTFETARAAHIGRQVAAEVRRARDTVLSVNRQ
jgi:hypothetical protein